MRLFGRAFSASLEALEIQQITKKERYEQHCNHPDHHLSYTVFNGDDIVEVGLEYAYIDVHADDMLLIASDGISRYLKYEKAQLLRTQTPEEMIVRSDKYDHPPYAKYADDKSVIKIAFYGE